MRRGLCLSFLPILAIGVLIASFAAAADPVLPKGVTRVTSVEGITEYRLENGLRVLLFPDASKPTITVNVTYLVGSRHEGYGETGMAHLLEHLVFKGTPKHPNVPQELTEHGCRPNGSTWFDRTNYFETFRAADENVEWALDLESDRMINSFIAKKDLDTEMTVVRNEFESGENDPAAILEERVLSTAYLWHNYGHSTIGARADLENVPIDRLQAFYKTYYQPDNAVLLVAGRFDEEKTLRLVDRFFAPIPKPARSLQTTYTAEPTQDGERTVTLRRVGDVQAVCAVYHVAAGSHPDAAAVDVLSQVLGDTPSGRLHKALVETKKASSVNSYLYQLNEPGVLVSTAEVRQDAPIDAASDALVATLEGIADEAPSNEEIERARTALLKEIDLTLNSADRVGIFMSEWIGMGDWRLFFLHRDRLKAVTPADVARVAAAYLKPSNRTVGHFIPTPEPVRAEIPATPDVAALVAAYQGEAARVAGEAFDPSPENIESRTTRLDLANGTQVALLPKKTRGGTVVAAMKFRFGDEKSLMNRSTAAQLAGSMLLRGTARHTRQQIQDELDRLKARVEASGEGARANVTIETVRENLPAVLRLVAEVLREPSFPAEEFEMLRQERLAQLEEMRSEPFAIAGVAYRRHLEPYPKGDVRASMSPEERIAEVSALGVDAARAFHREFYGGSNGQIALVGDFDGKETASLLGDLFGSWKSPRTFARVPEIYHDVAPVNESFQTPDKANAVFMSGLDLKVRDDAADYPALSLGNFLFGGGFLNSRLATRIRQKEGISYGVGSRLSASALDERGSFSAFAIYAPENGARLEAAFREEVDRVLKDGYTAEEIEAAKSGFIQGRQVRRSQDGALAGTLAEGLFWRRTLSWDSDFEKKVSELSGDGILEAMRRHIDPTKLTTVKAGDFEKGAGAASAGGAGAP